MWSTFTPDDTRCRALSNWRLAAAAGLLLSACAVPDADQSIARATNAAPNAAPQIEGAQGPLSAEESRHLIAQLAGPAAGDILQHHLVVEQAVAGTPLTADNAVAVLRDGGATFDAIAAAILGARRNINLEYYTIEDVTLDSAGKLSDLLVHKLGEGVAVNLIYDSYGSSDTPAAFFDRLKKAGAKLVDFHPVDPTPAHALAINDRDHRKIFVADGTIAIIGGVNLSKSYESKSPGSKNGTPTANGLPQQWRDTSVRISGPAVKEIQTLFFDHWQAEGGPKLDLAGYFPQLEATGSQVVRVIGSTPKADMSRYYVTLISALRSAEKRVWIQAAYFVPTPQEVDALVHAARRGVDVRLMVPAASDSSEAIAAGQSHYSELMDAGVKIYETRNVVLHSKTVVIDGVWSAVGSSNFDHRSVLFNDEIDAIILGSDAASALESIFEDGVKTANAIDRDQWEEHRPFGERVHGFFSRLWEGVL